MENVFNRQIALLKEMDETERAILALITEAESPDADLKSIDIEREYLVEKRYELMAKKLNLDIMDVIDCAIEVGISPEELMSFVLSKSKEKRSIK